MMRCFPYPVLSLLALVALAALGGCASTHFAPQPLSGAAYIDRAVVHERNGLTVTAAVPTDDEFHELTGIRLANDGIQPVWLTISNQRDEIVRVVHSSIDPAYFSPLEVAWLYRDDFQDTAQRDLEEWFHAHRLPRGVPAGTERSGFVYTHATTGTKSFNLDLHSPGSSEHFTFLVPVPGFAPDYLDVDFAALYDESDRVSAGSDELRAHVDALPAYSSDEHGQPGGDPLNIVVVATGTAMLRSLLRAGWQEQQSGADATRLARTHFYRGRPPDGTFHKSRPDGGETRELRLWLTPLSSDGVPVWLGQVSYEMSGRPLLRRFTDYHLDPDVDEARLMLVQDFWYAQSLAAIAFAAGGPAVPVSSPGHNFHGHAYFTDGRRATLFLSELPVAMDETEIYMWETTLAP